MKFSKCICPLVILFLVASTGVWAATETQSPKTISDVYPGLATAALRNAGLADLPAGVLLRCGEIKITQTQTNDRLKQFPPELQPKVKQDQFYLLEEMIAESLIYSEAYDWSVTNKDANSERGELISAYLDSRTKNITATDAEIKQFYEDNKAEMAGMQLDEVKTDISNVLLDGKRMEAVNAYMAAFSDRYEIEVDKTWAAKQYPLATNNPIEKARRAGKPLLVDFGSEGCGPCRKLAPILGELKKEYAGKADLLIIDVDTEPILGSRYGATAIPTQIFYDKTGKEVFRHTGFYSKANIIAKLAEIGAK